MLHDAHLHIHDEELIKEMKLHDIETIANASSLKEYAYLKELQKKWSKLHISAGIHPWDADKKSWEDMSLALEEALIIGEIGLDHVWCTCDLNKQIEIFRKQLSYAFQAHKPVILHLKGMEKEALPILKEYPNVYLIHWYSCENYLEEYIELGCYFTIGPSVGMDKAVDQVALKAPLDHILIETDGLDAVTWVDGVPRKNSDYVSILENSIEKISSLRMIDKEKLKKQVNMNFQKFLKNVSDYDKI